MSDEASVPVGQEPGGVRRILVREILPGDERKFVAKSNDSGTGGGARDLRLRPSEKFIAFLAEMFPRTETVERRLSTGKSKGTVRVGELHWVNEQSKEEKSAPIRIWEPTNARMGELRIATVHHFDLASELENAKTAHVGKPAPGSPDEDAPRGDRLLLLFVEMSSGRIYPAFTFASSLEDTRWPPKVSRFLKACLSASGHGSAACGWLDLSTGASYPAAS